MKNKVYEKDFAECGEVLSVFDLIEVKVESDVLITLSTVYSRNLICLEF